MAAQCAREDTMLFHDRVHAGRLLAKELRNYANDPSVLVLALPRGGVLVGLPVANALAAPLDVVIVRKLGMPGQEELALGAIASGGVCVLSHELIDELGISSRVIETIVAREQRELQRREQLYRGNAPAAQVSGRTVILVDDGIATGASMKAAAAAVRHQRPGRLIVAAPVAAPRTCAELAEQVDEVVCPFRPEGLLAIGAFYEDFHQVSDEEVREALQRAAQRATGRSRPNVA
jgi:putative phosphoribosyl transferase